MTVTVVGVRRYPVKSMGGEALDEVRLDRRGLAGDRWYAVEDADGRFASGKDSRRFRRRDAVFEYAARTVGPDVIVSGAGEEWLAGDPALDSRLSEGMGARVRVQSEAGVPHQDAGAVSLVGTATLAWCGERWGLDADPRRLRVNLVVETDEPFVEESWQGKTLVIGDAELTVVERIPRCRMIDIDQDGARASGRWLAPLAAERDLCLAVYADVASPGVIRLGDTVQVGQQVGQRVG